MSSFVYLDWLDRRDIIKVDVLSNLDKARSGKYSESSILNYFVVHHLYIIDTIDIC